MAENKTQKTEASVEDYLASIEPEQKREDSRALLGLMKRVTGEEPRMWGTSIIGFGDSHYVYESGREGDWFTIGFAPRKAALTLYTMTAFPERADVLSRLGKHTTGKGCIYIKKLEDIDADVLEELVDKATRSKA